MSEKEMPILNNVVVLRTILCLQIILLHVFSSAPVPQEKIFSSYQYGSKILSLFCRSAVPCFFIISGYLFFRTYENKKQCYLRKIKRRFFHLIIPIFAWTTIFFPLYYFMQRYSGAGNLLSGERGLISQFGFWEYVDAYTGIVNGNMLLSHLWFLRDLFILCLLAPFIWIFLKYSGSIGFTIIISVVYFLAIFDIIFIDMHGNAVIYFLMGAFLSIDRKIYKKRENLKKKSVKWIVYICYIFFIFLISVLYTSWYKDIAYYIMTFLGVVTVGNIAINIRKERILKIIMCFSGSTYFIFLIHYPLEMFVKRFTYKILEPSSGLMMLLISILIFIMVVAICYLIYYVLKKFAPKILNILTGNIYDIDSSR